MSKPKQSTRKFYKTVIRVEVLSERPFDNWSDLNTVILEITEGGCSGTVKLAEAKVLTAKQAAMGLIEQGSDPAFFRLMSNGQDDETDLALT